jgi:hypothetical protein
MIMFISSLEYGYGPWSSLVMLTLIPAAGLFRLAVLRALFRTPMALMSCNDGLRGKPWKFGLLFSKLKKLGHSVARY